MKELDFTPDYRRLDRGITSEPLFGKRVYEERFRTTFLGKTLHSLKRGDRVVYESIDIAFNAVVDFCARSDVWIKRDEVVMRPVKGLHDYFVKNNWPEQTILQLKEDGRMFLRAEFGRNLPFESKNISSVLDRTDSSDWTRTRCTHTFVLELKAQNFKRVVLESPFV